MTPIPLRLPPGMFRNGTAYQAKGRWYAGSLVRWVRGAITAVGGWERRTDTAGANIASLVPTPALEVVRAALAWRDTTNVPFIAFGSNLKLKVLSSAGSISAITPASLTAGSVGPSEQDGFGIALYGNQAYGTRRSGTGLVPTPAASWCLDNWGEDLLATLRGSSAELYEWSPGGGLATVVANAPTEISGFLVTEERMVMTYGGYSTETRRVKWSDVEDNTQWTPAATNQAGEIILPGRGEILSGVRVLSGNLLLTESDAHFGEYIGPPLVYGFRQVGTECAPISQNAVVSTDRAAYWAGYGKFWVFDGAVQELPCDVQDYLDGDVSGSMLSKATAHLVSQHNEVWWHYQSNDSATGEVDSYVAYNYVEKWWHYGRLDRTVGLDGTSGLRDPLYVDEEGYIYNHELASAPADASYVESGPLELAKGGALQGCIARLFPDVGAGTVTATIYGRNLPSDPEYTYGPFTLQNPTPTTGVQARQLRLRLDGTSGKWSVGEMRAVPAGVGGER